MDEWPPTTYDGDEEEEQPALEDVATQARRYRDPFSEAVGDAWETSTRRDPFGEPDSML